MAYATNIIDICHKRVIIVVAVSTVFKEIFIMARPRKCRKVCHFPAVRGFVPVDADESPESVLLTVDEYETIRLIDKEGLSQEQCGERMEIARTTVQQIYSTARKKIADALVEGLALRIDGGDYRICDGRNVPYDCSGCFRYRFDKEFIKLKGEDIMRIAVTYENGEIFQHFGHTREFKVYDVQDGKVTGSEVVNTGGSGHGALAGVLNALDADVLICGGIGGGARNALAAAGIKLYGGVYGAADDAVDALLAGNLKYDPDAVCSDHGAHHGDECGHHGEHQGGSCGGHGGHGCSH